MTTSKYTIFRALISSECGIIWPGAGRVHVDKPHIWHMKTLARLCSADPGLLLATPYRQVEMNDTTSSEQAIAWWTELTSAGNEGSVVKPFDFIQQRPQRVRQRAVECRAPEYLRVIYDPNTYCRRIWNGCGAEV